MTFCYFLLLSLLFFNIKVIAATNELKNSAVIPQPQLSRVKSSISKETLPKDETKLSSIKLKKIGTQKKNNEKLQFNSTQQRKPNDNERHTRNTKSRSLQKNKIECLKCEGSGVSKQDEECYQGEPLQKCICSEQCFIELHPKFIKRGCVSQSRLNRTFTCKCPLCNDKPYNDRSYYEYEKLRDWEYDNNRLKHSLDNLICKVCETKGINKEADKVCKHGSFADYMVCGRSQICYTNIVEDGPYVARGCVDKPTYNSFYYFCNQYLCNSKPFKNPNFVVFANNLLMEDIVKTKFVSAGIRSRIKNSIRFYFIAIVIIVI